MVAAPHRSLLATGYTALDVILSNGGSTQDVGGTAGNVACALAYLGWSTALAGSIGGDRAGLRVSCGLKEAGVDVSALTHDARGTPVVVQTLTPRGPKYSFRCPACGRKSPRYRPLSPAAASDYLAKTVVLPDSLFFDRVSAGSLILARAFREAGRVVVFEPSTLGRPHLFSEAASLADIVKFADDRMSTFAEFLPRRRKGQVRVVTMGRKGCRIHFEGRPVRQPAVQTNVLDSAGAGDWTTAGLLHALPDLVVRSLSSRDVEGAVAAGQALAALSVRFLGARGLAHAVPAELVQDFCQGAKSGNSERTARVSCAAERKAAGEPLEDCPSPQACRLAC